MTGCTITPIAAAKACSGKCRGVACGSVPRVWVVAACDGMISLFEKNARGELTPLSRISEEKASPLEMFQRTLADAEENHGFDQLIFVGGGGDIAWLHASTPPSAAKHIAAEIQYPLIAGWFREPTHLVNALKHVFAS